MGRLQPFLQHRLWIGGGRSHRISRAEIFAQRVVDEISRGFQSSVDKDCARDGFEDIGQQSMLATPATFFFAAAKPQEFSKM